jgi:integrase/recombinase XerD
LPEKITIEKAVTQFISAKTSEGLRESTITKLKTIFEKQLLTWAKHAGIVNLEEITDTHLEAFRDSWNVQALARKKKQERLVTFFYYCQRKKWISDNPAKLLGRIKVNEKPTDYFPADEFKKIIDATYIYNPKAWNTEPRNQATRVRTLILLMRWSGLAISDAAFGNIDRPSSAAARTPKTARRDETNDRYRQAKPDQPGTLRHVPILRRTIRDKECG